MFNCLSRLITKRHPTSASVALCEENPSPYKGSIMQKAFPCHGVIMVGEIMLKNPSCLSTYLWQRIRIQVSWRLLSQPMAPVHNWAQYIIPGCIFIPIVLMFLRRMSTEWWWAIAMAGNLVDGICYWAVIKCFEGVCADRTNVYQRHDKVFRDTMTPGEIATHVPVFRANYVIILGIIIGRGTQKLKIRCKKFALLPLLPNTSRSTTIFKYWGK